MLNKEQKHISSIRFRHKGEKGDGVHADLSQHFKFTKLQQSKQLIRVRTSS